jgi:biotin carboxyl carrier protein
MTFEIEIEGRTRSVSIERTGRGRYRVVVDGNAHLVDAARAGEFGLSVLLDRDGLSRELQVAPSGRRGELLVSLEGRIAAVNVNGRRSRRATGDSAGSGHGEQKILAPMPGRIVRVLVGPGDAVTASQPLVVVEAMKMENELRSPKAGIIKEVAVSAGMSVDAGRVLVTVA